MTPIYKQLTILALAVTVTACGDAPSDTTEPVSRPVKMFTVGKNSSGRTLEFPGSVSAVQQSDMAFEVSGRITEIPVTVGEFVEAGTVLVRLDPRDFEAERDRARAERNAARADFNRYDEAFKANAVTAQDVDRARRNLEVAEANLQRADKAVEDTVLRAPFAGRVARQLVEDFANVQAKQAVLVLQSDDALEMKINVPEADLARSERIEDLDEVTVRIKPRVTVSAFPELSIPARVTEFTSAADPVTRTFQVTVAFERPEGVDVNPGMTGHVEVDAPERIAEQGMLIPAAAVAATPDNTPFVWRVDPGTGTVAQTQITVGELTRDSIRVLSGLEDGDRIAVSGVHTLTEGLPVHALSE